MTFDDAPIQLDIEEAVAFQRDLYLYWWATREIGGLALTSRGFVARPELRRLRAQWPMSGDDRPEADDARLYFLRRLLERLGLLRASNTRSAGTSATVELLAAGSATMARYLAHPLAERLRICTRLWVAGGWWQDGSLAAAAGLHAPVQPRIALARRRLIEMLAAQDPGSPVEISGVPTATTHAPRIIGATATRRKPRGIAEERHQTMRAGLMGPLHWIGLVVWRGTPATAERQLVVGHGMLALRREPDDAAIHETYGRVIIQPNLDVLAYQPLSAPTLFTLDQCAARAKLDRVAHYRLTKESVIRAQQSGWSEDETARRLEQLIGGPLPGNVRVRLADWTRAASRVRLTSNAAVLTTATSKVLDALMSDRNARAWVVRRLGPAMALVAPADVEAVRRWLLAHGELPAVEGIAH
ncbi:MAG TPA: helicase-associated domain-containing protein [Ktedonobacterales bacterium]|nr:helicase-associated domain-containing protein [Ktedonobacterales bacterium]